MRTTVSTLRAMRHIPEEELHAYLDQALSRAQCVELESHLAACPTCRRQRDAIAALRDRTTSLLATLVPARTITPPFELIESRRAAAAIRREHMVRRAVWAASLIAAVGAGWGLSRVADGPDAASEIAVSSEQANRPATTDEPAFAPVTAAGDTAAQRAEADTVSALLGEERRSPSSEQRASNRSAEAPAPARELAGGTPAAVRAPSRNSESGPREQLAAPRSLQVSSSGLPEGLALEGLWRTVSWENAQEEAGGTKPAHVDGLPVVQVQVQQAPSGKPLMVVAQQLRSGEVIRTIEGPADDVSSLLRRTRPGFSPWPTIEQGDGTLTGGDGSILAMEGDRILAEQWSLDSTAGLARLAREMARQASMIGYLDAFGLYTLASVAALPLVLLVRVRKPE